MYGYNYIGRKLFYDKNIHEKEDFNDNIKNENLKDIKELFMFLEKNDIDTSYYSFLISNLDFENLQRFYRFFSFTFKKNIITEYNFKSFIGNRLIFSWNFDKFPKIPTKN